MKIEVRANKLPNQILRRDTRSFNGSAYQAASGDVNPPTNFHPTTQIHTNGNNQNRNWKEKA